jgi:putative ABC transport system permease protein
MMMLGMFGALALILSSVGLYGVLAYSVTQRSRELGVRVALGATPADLARLVVGQGLALTLVGVAIGLAGAFALTRLMESLIYGVTATDPLTFALVGVGLTAIAMLASYIPARRAAHADPVEALRAE